MAKKKSVNKSQTIRDALAKTPDISPKQLAADLNAKGIKVSPAFVSIVKSAAKAKTKRKIAPKSGLVADQLIEAKKLVDRVGGIENVESLLGTLKKLL